MESREQSDGGDFRPRRRFTVSADQDDRRIDRVLRALYPEVPLGAIMRALRKGAVRLNGGKTTGSERLVRGDIVEVPWEEDVPPLASAPANLPEPATLYRDMDLWCVEKEAGLLTQPDGREEDSLSARVIASLNWTRRDFRPAPVHRLDRNVSGVVAVALTARFARAASLILREGRLEKIYRALVWGDVPRFGEVSFSLTKDERDNRTRVDEHGKNSLTKYRRISGDGRVSLVELELVTGRPHQARVHMSVVGHPIVGDGKYGKRSEAGGRLMLHAYSLTFPEDESLPERIRGLCVTSPLPREFQFLGRVP